MSETLKIYVIFNEQHSVDGCIEQFYTVLANDSRSVAFTCTCITRSDLL